MTNTPRWRSVRRDEAIFPPIQPDHAQAIGYVVVHWSSVEEAVASVAGRLLGVEGDAAYAVTADMSSAGKLALVRALLTATRNQAWVDAWDEIEPELSRLQGARNDVVHGVWQVVGTTHWIHRVTARGAVRRRFREYSTATVLKDDADIRDLLDRLDRFRSDIASQANDALRGGWLRPSLAPGQGRRALDQADSKRIKEAQKAKADLRSRQDDAQSGDDD